MGAGISGLVTAQAFVAEHADTVKKCAPMLHHTLASCQIVHLILLCAVSLALPFLDSWVTVEQGPLLTITFKMYFADSW